MKTFPSYEDQSDAEISRVNKGLGNLPSFSDDLADEAAFNEANDVVRVLKGAIAELEENRKRIKQPFFDAGKAIDKTFRDAMQPIQDRMDTILRRMSDYQRRVEQERREAERAAREAAEKQRKALEAKAAKAEEKGDFEKAMNLEEQALASSVPEPAAPPPPKTKGISTRRRYVWDLVNLEKIPAEYLTLDEKAIGQVVRALGKKAESTIPGIRVREETTTQVRK